MDHVVTEKIKLWGIVQGVGFRPFVAKIADRMHMQGIVLNTGGLVEITVTDIPSRIDTFLRAIQDEKPEPAEIVHIKRTRMDLVRFPDFRIVGSAEGGDDAAMIPPDMAICPHCLKELYAQDDPRCQHPFISCMLCGPRYTIIDRIPYDRENTTMSEFPMCGFCQVQYGDKEDRRYHAQTISCHACGPYLKWEAQRLDSAGEETGGAGTEQTEENGREDALDEETSAALQRIRKRSARLRVAPGQDSPADRHKSADDRRILAHAAGILARGGVIAFKCVGGYNLVADPFNDDAVRKLREIKGRETKPFAVMFRDMNEVKYYCHMNETEARLLESSARPILLLEHRLNDEGFMNPANRRFPYEDVDIDEALEPSYEDLRQSRFIGSFLPSLAAQYLLLDRISPLIFTSANLSDMPMIKDDDEMMEWLSREPLIDGVVYNQRKIRVRVDDSVARVIDGQPQMIRRSKGYAPLPLHVDTESSGAADASGEEKPSASPFRYFLAAGSQLKNSFALTNGPFLYMSQYFGDLDSVENQEIYGENVDRMAELFRIRPQAVVCDMHPLYESTRFAKEYAHQHRIPLLQVQHHHAHVASVMAENDLQGKVIGVSFDGTGYGTDGCIWGGEILLCEGSSCQRLSHLAYVDMIGGDSSMKDAHRSALSYMAAAAKRQTGTMNTQRDLFEAYRSGMSRDGDEGHIASAGALPCDPVDENDCRQFGIDISDILAYGGERLMGCTDARMIFRAIESGINTVRSSSMGRLFDAVAALLDIKDYNDYEGQCAIMLEDAAAFALKHPGEDAAADLALAFHQRVIDAIVGECVFLRRQTGTDQVALTGGTFQNRILMEGVLEKLRGLGFKPFYNISVSPNDGGIALGQAYIAMHTRGPR